MLNAERAEAVAESLDLELSTLQLCPLCLFGVAQALRTGDPVELRGALRFFAPLLWDEGLAAPLSDALDAACSAGVPDAEAAAAEVERLGPTSRVVKAVVRRLAAQQLEELERMTPVNGKRIAP